MTGDSPQKICVTGGSGFIGRHLVRRLLTEGRTVRVLDLAPLPDDLAAAGVELIRASVLDPEAVASAVRGVDAVVHLAAKVSDHGRYRDFQRLNVEATGCVLRAARRAGVRRFLQMSSVAVFDYRIGYREAGEEKPTGGHEYAYGRTKLLAEELVRVADGGGLETVIVRPGLMPYGPEDRLSSAQIFDALERGRSLLVEGGTALLSTSYIDNLIDGVLLCLDHPRAAGETFHICDDECMSWCELIVAMAAALGVEPNLRSTPRWLAYPAAAVVEWLWGVLPASKAPPITRYRIRTATGDLHFSNAKARGMLGYVPRVGLEEGLAATVKWYRSCRSPQTGKEPPASKEHD